MDSTEEGGKPGTVVWAKLAGFALWPARLAKLSEVSPTVSKAKRGTRQQLVYFFGSYDYAWVSQVQPWDENYERNIKGSKAKAFAKGLKEARQWLSARKHAFPVYQVTSGDEEDSSESESESASSSSSSSDEEQLTSKRGSTKTGVKRRTAKGKQAASSYRKGRDGESGSGKLAKKDEASEGDAEGRRNAKRRRLEQRQTERQARDSDPEAMKRRVKRHTIQRRLGLCPPAGVREIVLLQRERKTREEKDASATEKKEKRAKQKAKERKEEEQKKKMKKKKEKERGEDYKKKKDRTGKTIKKRKRDKDGDRKERPTKSRKTESTEEGKRQASADAS